MQDAAKNPGGAGMAFMGMNMAGQAGGFSAQGLYQMGQQQATPAPAAQSDGKSWLCPACGTANKGKFCCECGAKKPGGVPQYRCDKCGWEPADPTKPPKFCPECGDPFGDEDIVG